MPVMMTGPTEVSDGIFEAVKGWKVGLELELIWPAGQGMAICITWTGRSPLISMLKELVPNCASMGDFITVMPSSYRTVPTPAHVA